MPYLQYRLDGLFDQCDVIRKWGRIGQPGTVRNDWYTMQKTAQQIAQAIYQQKIKRDYLPQ
jgi:predicted DNA-binding WGR domain protein